MTSSRDRFIFLQQAIGIVMLAVAAQAGSPADRAVDSVTPGDEQNERAHSLKGDQTDTFEFNGAVFRRAGTNGWFSWELKLLPDQPQELSVDFGGSTGRRGTPDTVEILANDATLGTVRLNGGPRREYYSLTNLTGNKSSLTVKFKAAPGSRISGVGSVSVAKTPLPTIASLSKASSPRTNYQFIVNAINDLREPVGSRDRLKRHFDWWPAKGTNQWVQYDFAKPARVSAVAVYWFDDTGIGECRLPKSWQAFYRDNGEWKPVAHPSGYGCEADRYNRTTFDPVETDGLRLDVELPERFSSGLLQWRVE